MQRVASYSRRHKTRIVIQFDAASYGLLIKWKGYGKDLSSLSERLVKYNVMSVSIKGIDCLIM